MAINHVSRPRLKTEMLEQIRQYARMKTVDEREIFRIRRILIELAEKESEALIFGFDYFVDVPKARTLYHQSEQLMLDYCEQIENWLKEQYPKDRYVAFPALIGKYKKKSNGVFFKNPSDAILFKLTCI